MKKVLIKPLRVVNISAEASGPLITREQAVQAAITDWLNTIRVKVEEPMVIVLCANIMALLMGEPVPMHPHICIPFVPMEGLPPKIKDTPEGRAFLIETNMSAAGGWKKEFLFSIGVSWPPTRGWRKKFIKSGRIPWTHSK